MWEREVSTKDTCELVSGGETTESTKLFLVSLVKLFFLKGERGGANNQNIEKRRKRESDCVPPPFSFSFRCQGPNLADVWPPKWPVSWTGERPVLGPKWPTFGPPSPE